MKVKKISAAEAVGHILVHNQSGPDGRRVLRKGSTLTAEDIATLRKLGQDEVFVAILDETDVDENSAAHRLGQRLRGPGIEVSKATTGRVNLIAEHDGILKVNIEALLQFNSRPGITLATKLNNSPVETGQVLGTIKIIPYSVPEADLVAAETAARAASIAEVRSYTVSQAVLIYTGSEAAKEKVIGSFTGPLRERLAAFGTRLIPGPYAAEEVEAIAEALRWALDQKAQMVLVAGETSIMDTDDITPRAIKAIGGEIIYHGVPVEPGNLFLLAYRDTLPIVGAPGCARSKSYNIVDMVLPRLVAGEHLTRPDLIALGHGGYLK